MRVRSQGAVGREIQYDDLVTRTGIVVFLSERKKPHVFTSVLRTTVIHMTEVDKPKRHGSAHSYWGLPYLADRRHHRGRLLPGILVWIHTAVCLPVALEIFVSVRG
ncbi:hypothetical protein OUZ56_015170 [Daphnia magna]|uniref:Uncharacterized protein n=1 Tax=Daphnia magna TaxID=35525 RepID=A0ABR0AM20_9CRUS|nr:hypothetical protein OUZ56_015170 [Daphnia magna]